MVKKMMSFVAVAAMALTIGGGLIAKTDDPEFIWEYQDSQGGTTTGNPECIEASTTCALLFHYDPDAPDNIGAPVIDEDTQEQVKALGVRSQN